MCGIFGAFNVERAAEFVCVGLHAMQHRAIDYAGIVSTDGRNLYRRAGADLARRVFSQEELKQLHGDSALGHIRYPTVADDPRRDNTQPIVGVSKWGPVAFAHNGNLTNGPELREGLQQQSPLATSMDTEAIVRLFCEAEEGCIEEALETALAPVRGSYSLGVIFPDRLLAARDPSGNRPFCLGRQGDGWFISSETCGLDAVGAEYVREVEPGEAVTISKHGLTSHRLSGLTDTPLAYCRFEGIYYSHPASRMFTEEVADFRIRLGQKLEDLYPVPEADIVVPVPDSSVYIAIGYADSGRSGRYWPVILRSHYMGRTFIAATQMLREALVRQKFSVVADQVEGRVIVVVDDSIVRLTTMPAMVRLLKEAGARAVHVRIGSPPIAHPCLYGINTPTYKELAAANHSLAEIERRTGADSLYYLSMEGLRGLSPNPNDFCYGCMTGQYPLPT